MFLGTFASQDEEVIRSRINCDNLGVAVNFILFDVHAENNLMHAPRHTSRTSWGER